MLFARALGSGKDGRVYAQRPWLGFGPERVVKVLSPHGRLWNPAAREAVRRLPPDPRLVELTVEEGRHVYARRADFPPDLSRRGLAYFLSEAAQLQARLLDSGLLYWDWGMSAPNYRYDLRGFYLIDYGGNAWMFPGGRHPLCGDERLVRERRFILEADAGFVRAVLLVHACRFYLGEPEFAAGRLRDLHSAPGVLEEVLGRAADAFRRAGLAELHAALCRLDLLTRAGWEAVGRLVSELVPQELPDLASFERLSRGRCRVRGYQNYDLSPDGVRARALGHPWAVSERKFAVVRSALERLRGSGRSFLDAGSNLGMYVFLADTLGYRSAGADYHPVYAAASRAAAAHAGFERSRFLCASFSEELEPADVVFAGGILHHLFGRTERFGSLDGILERLAGLTRAAAVVEMPTEDDPKAAKWTRGDRGYTLASFLKAARTRFAGVEPLGEAAPGRPLYLLTKG